MSISFVLSMDYSGLDGSIRRGGFLKLRTCEEIGQLPTLGGFHAGADAPSFETHPSPSRTLSGHPMGWEGRVASDNRLGNGLGSRPMIDDEPGVGRQLICVIKVDFTFVGQLLDSPDELFQLL